MLAEYGTNAQPNTLQLRPVLAVRPPLFTPLEQLIRPTIQIVTVPRGKGASTTTALDECNCSTCPLCRNPTPRKLVFGGESGLSSYSQRRRANSRVKGRGRWDPLRPSATAEFQGCKLSVFFSR